MSQNTAIANDITDIEREINYIKAQIYQCDTELKEIGSVADTANQNPQVKFISRKREALLKELSEAQANLEA